MSASEEQITCKHGHIRPRDEKPCRTCNRLAVARYKARGGSPMTQVRQQTAKAFVADLNAKTLCAHCGDQPIEWHNPEHVELNRRHFRISAMADRGYTPEKIQEELDRCTALCRSCHMKADGRLSALIESSPLKIGESLPPQPCQDCGRLYKPLRRGLCARDYDRRFRPERGRKAS